MSGAFDKQLKAASPPAPLHNGQAEIGLLGDLINDNRLIDDVADRLRPGDFSVPLHGQVYGRMLEQSAAGTNVDAVTLAPFFAEEEHWPRLYAVLSAAALNAGPRARSKAYFEQIMMLSRRRRLVAGLEAVIGAAHDVDATPEELLADADDAVGELLEQATIHQAPAAIYADAVIDSFGRPIVGVRSGLIGSLDSVTGVLRPGNLVVVGGRPGMGKTSLLSSYCVGAGMRGHGSLFFSMEMSGDELLRRMLADLTFTPKGGVLYERVRDGTVRGADLDAVHVARRRLDELPLEINETAGLTLAKLIRHARSHKRRLAARGQKLELVVVDYLQLMTPSRKGMSPYEHVTEVSQGLKQFAKAEGLTVMAAAQLSREVEKRPDKRPMPADLRESGQIEQDADVILFVYREEEYLRRAEPEDQFGPKYEQWRTDMEAVRNKIEFLVPKRRSGPTGKAMGWFFGAHSAVRGADFYSSGGQSE